MFCGCDIKQPVHRLPYFKEKRYCFRGIFDVANCDIKVNNTKSADSGAIYAQTVHANDNFEYEYGLEPKLIHRPAATDRGDTVFFYGMFRTINGGCGFSVMSKEDMDLFAGTYSIRTRFLREARHGSASNSIFHKKTCSRAFLEAG